MIDLAARLLYRDALMLVIDKPAGLPVHAGPKGGDHLGLFLDQLRFGLPKPPELAHRLDKDTSGCLVLGRHAKALKRLNRLFAEGRVDKTYWAVVEGGPDGEAGRIDLPLAKRSPERGWWMRPDPEGLPSVTDYRVLARGGGRSWLALSPLTGRTHQLRVHCAASGFPIVGDAIYGSAPRSGGEPLMLHARRVAVPLYPKREAIVVEAEPPEAMAAAIRSVRGEPEVERTDPTRSSAALGPPSPKTGRDFDRCVQAVAKRRVGRPARRPKILPLGQLNPLCCPSATPSLGQTGAQWGPSKGACPMLRVGRASRRG